MFELKTETLEVRGQSVTVREMTVGQRAEWAKLAAESSTRLQPALIAMCVASPPLTEEQATALPTEVGEAISAAAFRLSGLERKAGKKD